MLMYHKPPYHLTVTARSNKHIILLSTAFPRMRRGNVFTGVYRLRRGVSHTVRLHRGAPPPTIHWGSKRGSTIQCATIQEPIPHHTVPLPYMGLHDVWQCRGPYASCGHSLFILIKYNSLRHRLQTIVLTTEEGTK